MQLSHKTYRGEPRNNRTGLYLFYALLGLGVIVGGDYLLKKIGHPAKTETSQEAQQTSQQAKQDEQYQLPALTSRPVNFAYIEPANMSDGLVRYIRNSIGRSRSLADTTYERMHEMPEENYLEGLLKSANIRYVRDLHVEDRDTRQEYVVDFVLNTWGTGNNLVAIDVTSSHLDLREKTAALEKMARAGGRTLRYSIINQAAYSNFYEFTEAVNNVLRPFIGPKLRLETDWSSSIETAFFADLNNDGKKELVVFTRGSKGMLEIYSMDYTGYGESGETKLLGKLPDTGIPKNIQVFDVTGDGTNDIVFEFTSHEINKDFPYTAVVSENIKFNDLHLQAIAGQGYLVRDLDGDGKPEFHDPYGRYNYEWDSNKAIVELDRELSKSLMGISDAMADAIKSKDKDRIESVSREIESMYPNDIVLFARQSLATNPSLQSLLQATSAQSLAAMSTNEFMLFAGTYFAADVYRGYTEGMRQRNLMIQRGGNPDIHTAYPGFGNPAREWTFIDKGGPGPMYKPQLPQFGDRVTRDFTSSVDYARGRASSIGQGVQNFLRR